MDKIKKISRLFRIFFQTLFWLQPVFAAFYWVTINKQGSIFSAFGADLPIHPHYITLNATSRILGFIVSLLIPTALWMYGFRCLIRLFRCYENGQIFAVENAKYYRNLGYTLLIWFFANLVYLALISLILTFQNVGHYKTIMVGMDWNNWRVLVAAGIIILISWIMKEGAKLSQDQALTI